MLVDTINRSELGHYMGYIGLSLTLAFLMGPLLGGVVHDAANYQSGTLQSSQTVSLIVAKRLLTGVTRQVFGMCWALLGVDVILRLVLVEKRVAIKWQLDLDAHEDTTTHQSDSHTNAENDVESHRTNEMTDLGHSLVVAGADNALSASCEGIAETSSPPEDSTWQPSPASVSDESSAQHPNHADMATRQNRLPAIFHLLKSPRLLAALWAGIVQSTLLTALDVSS